jgi:hypothetical protein
MKALWIRVDAHVIDSIPIARFSEALELDAVTALGYYVALGGAIAEHTDDGVITDVADATLEGWARWKASEASLPTPCAGPFRTTRANMPTGSTRWGNLSRGAPPIATGKRWRKRSERRARRKNDGAWL